MENRPGLAGTSSVAKGAADGYTLMLTSNGHTVISHLNKNLAFDPLKDFSASAWSPSRRLILTVPANSPAKTLKDLIALAKSKPGDLNYSSAGLGSTTGIAGHLLKATTKTDIVHVPFKGLPETHTAIIRGDVALGFTFFNAGGDLIQSGKMRALAVTGADAALGAPRRSDLQGGGAAGVRVRRLVRHHGAGRRAQGHRRQGQPGHRRRCCSRPTSRRASSRRAWCSCPCAPESSTRPSSATRSATSPCSRPIEAHAAVGQRCHAGLAAAPAAPCMPCRRVALHAPCWPRLASTRIGRSARAPQGTACPKDPNSAPP